MKNNVYWNITAVGIFAQLSKIVISILDSIVPAIDFLIQTKFWPLIDFGLKTLLHSLQYYLFTNSF